MDRTLVKDLPTKVGDTVTIMGWIDTIREHGKLIFIDLRDRYGKVQCVIHKSVEDFEKTKELTVESCVALTGEVKERPGGTQNEKLGEIGSVELSIKGVEVYTKSQLLPFEIKREDVSEDIRLKYRFLDLRTPNMQHNLLTRGKIMKVIRDYMYEQDFNEFETPILGKSTPEGARDYVVPSRTQPGKFFALPQSPQLFKQLMMVAGFERYFQIARCMRDEDLRSDRQPEFTQLDVEMSFVSQEDIITLMEGLIQRLWKEVLDIDVKIPFQRMSYKEAMEKHGSDAPDLRKNKEDKNEFAFCWVVDFPAFEYSKEEDKFVAIHHPFTQPESESFKKDPKTATSIAHDLVLNGSEIGGGSIRIHDAKTQEAVFKVLGIEKEEQREKFGFLLDALSMGAPPHGGIALGLDRLVQLMVGADSIREVIAFPKNKEARDLMLDAPSSVSKAQLKDIHIGLDLPKSKKGDAKDESTS